MELAPAEALDHGLLDEILIRWKLAELQMRVAPFDGTLPSAHALRCLLKRDIPTLIHELCRLRPDLE
jgi:hypothetical protein